MSTSDYLVIKKPDRRLITAEPCLIIFTDDHSRGLYKARFNDKAFRDLGSPDFVQIFRNKVGQVKFVKCAATARGATPVSTPRTNPTKHSLRKAVILGDRYGLKLGHYLLKDGVINPRPLENDL